MPPFDDPYRDQDGITGPFELGVFGWFGFAVAGLITLFELAAWRKRRRTKRGQS